MAEYRLSPSAKRDLEAIWRYTFDRWGLARANLYTDTLTKAFDELVMQPGIAAPCDMIRPGYRRFVVEKHVIYFRVVSYGISIIRILHVRMDSQRHL